MDAVTAALGGGFKLIGDLDAFDRYEYSVDTSDGDHDRFSHLVAGFRYTF